MMRRPFSVLRLSSWDESSFTRNSSLEYTLTWNRPTTLYPSCMCSGTLTSSTDEFLTFLRTTPNHSPLTLIRSPFWPTIVPSLVRPGEFRYTIPNPVKEKRFFLPFGNYPTSFLYSTGQNRNFSSETNYPPYPTLPWTHPDMWVSCFHRNSFQNRHLHLFAY